MIDIEALLRSVDLASLVSKSVKLEKDGKEWRGLCPFHKENSPSFCVFSKGGKQMFYCFGCQEKGDAIDWVMKIGGVDWNKAAELLGADKVPAGKIQQAPIAEQASVYDDYVVKVLPAHVTDQFAPGEMTPRIFNPKRAGDPKREWGKFAPTLVHPYRSAAGELLGVVLRHDLGDGRKETPLIRWVRRKDGGDGFWSRFPFGRDQRPLYGLDRLAAAPAAPVLVVEGEKTADAMVGILPPYVPICWQGGAQAWNRSDWSPVAGRSVLLWPDADEPGLGAMYGIGAQLERLDNTSIRICHPALQSLEAAA